MLPALLLLAACGDHVGSAGPVVVRDSAGVRIVTSEAPVWREDAAWRLSAEPVLRIGELDGAPEYQFERVVGAVRRADGGIVVADAGLRALRLYDAAGKFLRTVGRKGGGPGEFEELASVHLAPGDSLLAFDWRLRRISVFAPDGSPARSVNLPASIDAVFPLPHLLGRLSDGSLLVGVGHRYRGGPATDGVRHDSTDYLRYSPAGVLLDTVAVVPSGESFVKTGFGRVGFTTAPLLFGKNSVSGLVGDRVVRGHNRAYEIGIYSPEGRLERLIRREQKARPATRADFDALVAANLEELDRGWRDRMEQVYAAMPRVSTMPFYSELLADDAQNLWVRDFSVQHGAGSTWTVFNAGGRMLGVVAMPERFRPTHIGEDHVLGVRRDELGVEYVQMFALEKGERGDR
ncbi:MAG: 6-bladed beta-propeller [Gemmatimonadota bacterium]